MTRKIALLPLLFVIFCLPVGAENPDADVQWILDKYQIAKPVSLIPAQGFSGWTKHYGEKLPSRLKWKNEEGKLTFDQSRDAHGGDLVTAKQYTNFILDFAWTATKGCNSGIKYRLKDFGKAGAKVNYSRDFGWLGCEYQILDDDNNGEGKSDNNKRSASSLYSVLAPNKVKKHLNPHGQTNTGRIVVLDNHIEHWLNGEKVLEYEIGSDAWKKALLNSKYVRKDAKVEGFGENPSGFIMIQDHQHSIVFEKIVIREIGSLL